MPADVIRINSKEYDSGLVRKFRGRILAGGIVIFPTETFYGLGSNAFDSEGVKAVYEMKGRDRGKPLPVVAADVDAAMSCADRLPRIFYELVRLFWPGPLTLVVYARPVFPPEMLGKGGTVAIRVPGMPWLRDLLKDLGVPLTATSANLSGQGECADSFKIVRDFQDRDITIFDGGRTPGGLTSTIIDLTGPAPKIVREGAIPAGCLAPYLA
ncbi:MAG: threonylcarbamoyl-AMP synthase [Candidatus Aminicenantes bacterium]|nr:threonylcarbamoyl-AMP synthase [Candidatus Aminicenantes bacterium]